MNVMILPIGSSAANVKLDRTLHDNDGSTKVDSQLWYELMASHSVLLEHPLLPGLVIKLYVKMKMNQTINRQIIM